MEDGLEQLKRLMVKRVSEGQVARVLEIIASPPNLRSKPLEGDLKGRFHHWFDGGAYRLDTGFRTYQFTDGTKVLGGQLSLSWLSVHITFPDGRVVHIEQERDD